MLVLQKELSDEPLTIWTVSHIGAFVGCFNLFAKSICAVRYGYDVIKVIVDVRSRAEEPFLSTNGEDLHT